MPADREQNAYLRPKAALDIERNQKLIPRIKGMFWTHHSRLSCAATP